MADSSAFPWLKHLPEDDQREFFMEVHQAIGDAVLDTMPGVQTPSETYVRHLDPLIASWRTTAEVLADPELKRILTSETGFNEEEFVEVPRPELPRRVRAPRKLCPMNIPHEEKADTARWCVLTAGHIGLHRDREGFTWNNGDERRARSLEEFPGPRHGE
jgi:hypothetical protein